MTIGTVYIDPASVAVPGSATRAYTIEADLEVFEATPGTCTAEVQLLDASNTSLGSASSTLGAASAFPQHCSSGALTPGVANGQVKPAATTYLVQLRRQGGAPGDLAMCHNLFVKMTWS